MREKIAAAARLMIGYPLFLGAMTILGMTWVPAERKRLISRLNLRPGQRVLDHCTGPGGNLPSIAKQVAPGGKVVALDLLQSMLVQAQRLARRKNINVELHQADALSLPYENDYFDTVIHYGTINQFGEKKRQVINEMLRVTKEGGTIAICDEGIENSLRTSLRGRILLARNPLFSSRPPLDLLPESADPQVEWVMGGIFYEMRFKKPSNG